MKRLIAYMITLTLFCSCHWSNDNKTELRGEECMIAMLLPESPFAGNDVVDDVIQQLTDRSVETDINLMFIEPDSGEYETKLDEILSQKFPYTDGNALLVAIDNSMQLTVYETDVSGCFRSKEHHRIELFGVGYLTGLCVGLMDLNTLVLQSPNQADENLRYGDGFLVGFNSMQPESDVSVLSGQIVGIDQLSQYADTYGWDVIITNYGVAEPWNGQQYFDYDVDYGYGRLVSEYLDTWMRFKPRKNAPDEVISLSSGYIDFNLNNQALLSELIEIHWAEAVELEEQYVSPYITVK